MVATLQDIMAPFGKAELQDALRERRLVLQRGADPSRFECLLDWPTLRALITENRLPVDKFKLTFNTRPVPTEFYANRKKVEPANFDRLFRQGVSLVTDPIQSHVPPLNALCADIAAQTDCASIADVIVTTGKGGALATHYDFFDVVALQVHGRKRWLIYGPPVADPVLGMAQRPPPEGEPLFDETLHAGDLLVMPAGYWHRCENLADLSLHIAVGIRAPTGWHAMRALARSVLEDDLFRVPLTRFTDAADKDAHEAAIKARLIEKIGQMSLSELAAEALKRRGERR